MLLLQRKEIEDRYIDGSYVYSTVNAHD
jgi:hypothetical protein